MDKEEKKGNTELLSIEFFLETGRKAVLEEGCKTWFGDPSTLWNTSEVDPILSHIQSSAFLGMFILASQQKNNYL